MRRIGFIGLGKMGRGICHNLIEAGNEMAVYDVSREAMEFFGGQARLCASETEVLAFGDVIFLSLPNSNVVEQIVEGFLREGVRGKLIVDLSTSNPLSTRKLCRLIREAGGELIDSPLIAGPEEAWNKTLSIVVAGNRKVIEQNTDLFASYCADFEYVGESGNGHLVKLAQNWAGLSQAILYAQIYPVMEQYGIPSGTLYRLLSTEFFDNWFFRFYSEKYVKKDYRMDFALELGLKDLSYIKELCDTLNIPGFMLDGALDLCRVSLKESRDARLIADMSQVAETVSQYIKSSAG